MKNRRKKCAEDAEKSFSLEKFLFSLENMYFCAQNPQT